MRVGPSLLLLLFLLGACADTRPHAAADDASRADASPALPPPDAGALSVDAAAPPSVPSDDAGAIDPDVSPLPADAGVDADIVAPDAADAGVPPAETCPAIVDPCAEPSVVRGDVTIASEADLDALAGVTCIDGAVRVTGDEIRHIALPALRRVTGDLQMQQLDGLETIELACVERVEGFLVLGDPRLTALRLPRLTRSARVSVRANEALSTIDVGQLEHATSVSMWQLPQVERIDLDRLATVRESMEVSENTGLTQVALGALATVGSIDVQRNAVLERLDLPQLETGSFVVGGEALREVLAPLLREAEQIAVYEGHALEVVRLSSLRSVGRGGLRLGGADAARELDLGQLERVTGSLELSFCEVPALELPMLTFVGHVGLGFIAEGDFGVSDCSTPSIVAPRLATVYGNVRITRNRALTQLDLPSLAHAGLITIEGNTSLSQCATERQFEPLGAYVADNDVAAVCE